MSEMFEVLMPLMGEGVFEATLTNWLIAEGQPVEKDQPLLEVSTDKVDTEIPAPASGFLVKLQVKPGSVVKVNQCLAYIASSKDAAQSAPAPRSEAASSSSAHQTQAEHQAPARAETAREAESPGSQQRSSPLVRKIAKERGIDLAQVNGSGLHGRITKKDILDFAPSGASASPNTKATALIPTEASPAAGPRLSLGANAQGQETLDGVPVVRETMSRMRQLIADHMVESVRTSPHVTTVFEMDLSRIVNLRDRHKATFLKQEGFKLTLTPFFIHATVEAIKRHPIVNVSVDGYDILWKKDINIGCAVALENGLIVPVIKQAGDLSLLGVARRLNDLVVRARSKKLKPEDVQGGTFSITNPGGWGSILSNPIINQPQVAILGIGAAVKRPVIVDDMIAVRPMMYMSLTFDHRVIDGEGGSKFLATLKEMIEAYDESPL